jgi:hypothetical protein
MLSAARMPASERWTKCGAVLVAATIAGCDGGFGFGDVDVPAVEDSAVHDTRVDTSSCCDTGSLVQPADTAGDGETDVEDTRPPATPSTLSCAWAHAFSANALPAYPQHVAVDREGNVYVSGSMLDSTGDFGGGKQYGTVYVVKLDAMGSYVWSTTFRASKGSFAYHYLDVVHMALDPTGGVVIGARGAGDIDLGNGTLGGPGRAVVFARIGADGKTTWSRRFESDDANVDGVAVDDEGRVVVAGDFRRAIDLGKGPLPFVKNPYGADVTNLFVAKLDIDGTTLWSHSYGDGSGQFVNSLAMQSGGEPLLVGGGAGFIDFGGGAVHASTFVAGLTATGDSRFTRDLAAFRAARVRVTSSGELLLTGDASGPTTLGGPLLAASPEGDAWFARLDAKGGHVASRVYGGAIERESGVDLVPLADGSAIVVGAFKDTTVLGGKTIVGAGKPDGFVMHVTREGDVVDATRLGGEGDHWLAAAAPAADGTSAILVGIFSRELTLGTSTFSGPTSSTGHPFVASCTL